MLGAETVATLLQEGVNALSNIQQTAFDRMDCVNANFIQFIKNNS